ncbi:hypothetical protein NW768_002555 [Fusarium equiseti]|uniref:Uncharacterized protein n=1 Tax=Fusarium equiseti TaxID=61235 RepID=A0ABQ8RP50_FUSEQ|nr:hypothetical protein NW768_002555 [Fusarium equiseti]
MEDEEQSRSPYYAVVIGSSWRCVVDSYAKARALCEGVKGARNLGCGTEEEAQCAYSPAAHKRWQMKDSQDGLSPLQSPDNSPPVVIAVSARLKAAARRSSSKGLAPRSQSTQSTGASLSTADIPSSPHQAISSVDLSSTQTRTPMSSDDGFGNDGYPRQVKRARTDDDGDYYDALDDMVPFENQSDAMFYLIQAFKEFREVRIGKF